MRRISLALALAGAVTATGCGGGTSDSTGDAKGVAEGTFTVMVQNGQNGNTSLAITGGTVVSVPAGINCGVGLPLSGCTASFPSDSTVVLTATATVSGVSFLEWSGDCWGEGTCTLTGKADKYVLARFGTAADRGSHANYNDPVLHAAQYRAFALQCNACHGLNWTGLGIAPSCYGCHDLDDRANNAVAPTATDGHFSAASHAFGDHTTGWSQGCLRCHTNRGFQDYVGVDGTPNNYDGTFNTTNALTSTTVACETAVPSTCNPAAYQYGPLTCKTCHNAVTDPVKAGITRIMFPKSLATVTTDRVTALCGQCHQGREAAASVNTKIGTTTPDTVIATGNSFVNPHYLGAAGTLFGTEAKMWAEYPGKIYTGRNKHGVNEGKCTSCHNPHTGALPADGAEMTAACGRCHFDELSGAPVSTFVQLEESRQFGFEGDIDGDGIEESLRLEIEGLEATLYSTMSTYSASVAGTAICYDGLAYPYYFKDNGAAGGIAGNGICEVGEETDPDLVTAGNQQAYASFTPRLLRAAFNYKWAHAEPGAWAHNPRYVIEILFDGIADLKEGLGTPLTIANVTDRFRSFDGHFGGARAAAPYRAFVYSAFPATSGFGSAACYQCHGGEGGLAQYLSNPSGASLTTASKVTGLQCTTCHAPAAGDTDFKRIRSDVTNLYFPPQKTAAQQTVVAAADLFPKAADRVCATCHSGREGTLSLNPKFVGIAADSWTLGFTNPHYLGAAGVMFGDRTKMLGQYEGKTYTSNPIFFGSPHGSPHGQSCTGCHRPQASKHTFEIDRTYCDTCHVVTTYGDFRLDPPKANVTAYTAELYTAIKAYAAAAVTAGVTGANYVCYNGASHPYWYVDTNANGTCDTGESTGAKFNPALARAAFNYKFVKADPGAYAHNIEYVEEILFDSIESLGATPTFARPVPAP